jgi:membrane peptidoglycan carboxypeptidase
VSAKITAMSAQNTQPQGVFGAIAGMLGFSVLAGILVAVMLTPGLAISSLTASNTIGFFDRLPEYIDIGEQPQENKIVALNADGETYTQIATVYSQNREEVQWDEVSQFVKDATVAGEDIRFYEHGGVDVQGLVRAALTNTISGGVQSGASTLTMQLVKNIYIQRALQEDTEEARKLAIADAQRTEIDRKLKEMKLAIGLEKRYTKDEILLAYLNIAGFGNNTYGIQAAAQRYYGVDAKDLDLAQSASLVAIVQQPGARSLNDSDHYAANKKRRDVILGNMRVANMISDEDYKAALAVPVDDSTVHLALPSNGCIAALETARQFCDYIVKSVKDLEALGEDAAAREEAWKIGGYTIVTTINLDLQATAQETLRTYAPPDETRLQLGASSTILQVGTGRILVMAQNKGFDDTLDGAGPAYTAINFNTDQPYGGSSGFQVGSTYKIFTLLNWLQQGHGLNEVVNAEARTENQASFTDTCDGPYGGTWKFRNDSGEKGTRTVMAATAGSVNGAYVSMALKLDLCDTKKIAESLGVHTAIRTDNPDTAYVENKILSNPSSILGTNDIAPMTIAAAYAALANGGTYCKPIAVDKIFNSAGEELPGQQVECSPSLVDAEVSAAAVYALQGAMNGYGANPRDGIPHMGKTGTTNSSKQTWVVNSSSAVTSITWVGNIIGDFPMRNYRNSMGSGGTLRHSISKAIMLHADSIYGGEAFPSPPARLLTGTGVTLDNFIGQTPENAKSIIEARGLVYADGGEVDSDLPAGQVAQTDPAAGTVMATGMTVTVYTSNGSMSALPDVVSGNPDFASAQATLATKDFMNVTQYCVVTLDPGMVGKVLESQPAPGTIYRRSNEVKLGVGALSC